MDYVETSGHLELGRLKAVASAHHADRLDRNLVDGVEALARYRPLRDHLLEKHADGGGEVQPQLLRDARGIGSERLVHSNLHNRTCHIYHLNCNGLYVG